MEMSVIIPTYNRSDSFQDTLRYIENSLVYPSEILIIDQTQDREKRDRIENICKDSFLNIRYFHRNVPSLTSARNFGLSVASHDIIVCMDDDVRIQSNTLGNVLELFADQSISLIAGIDLNSGKTDSKLGYLFGRKNYFRRTQGHVTAGVYGRLPQTTDRQVNTEYAMGYFFCFRKHLALEWELGWDEKFSSYAFPEDLDFSYRYYLKSKENQLRCVVDPQVSVYHMRSIEWRETSKFVTYMMVINREYLSYKWKWPMWTRLVTRWANFGLFLQRLKEKDRPLDVIEAQIVCDLHRREIKNGRLLQEQFLDRSRK